jgi:hypothetical protein
VWSSAPVRLIAWRSAAYFGSRCPVASRSETRVAERELALATLFARASGFLGFADLFTGSALLAFAPRERDAGFFGGFDFGFAVGAWSMSTN